MTRILYTLLALYALLLVLEPMLAPWLLLLAGLPYLFLWSLGRLVRVISQEWHSPPPKSS